MRNLIPIEATQTISPYPFTNDFKMKRKGNEPDPDRGCTFNFSIYIHTHRIRGIGRAIWKDKGRRTKYAGGDPWKRRPFIQEFDYGKCCYGNDGFLFCFEWKKLMNFFPETRTAYIFFLSSQCRWRNVFLYQVSFFKNTFRCFCLFRMLSYLICTFS